MTTWLLHTMVAGLVAGVVPAGAPSITAGVVPRAAPAFPDACALLTQAEAEVILGEPIEPPTKGGSGECHYAARSGSGEILVYPMPLGFKSKEEFHAFIIKDTEAMNARVKKNLEKTGATVKETTVDPVPGIGEAAYFVDPSLIVLQHGRVLNIIAADRAQAVTVAAKVVPRIE